jgi:hypothetical protein
MLGGTAPLSGADDVRPTTQHGTDTFIGFNLAQVAGQRTQGLEMRLPGVHTMVALPLTRSCEQSCRCCCTQVTRASATCKTNKQQQRKTHMGVAGLLSGIRPSVLQQQSGTSTLQ